MARRGNKSTAKNKLKRPIRVFVAHSHEDNTVTAALVERLQAHGYQVWADLYDIQRGDFVEQINAALHQSDCLVLVESPAALHSRAVEAEVDAALRLVWSGVMRSAVRYTVRDVQDSDVPPLWSALSRIDATSDPAQATDQLVGMLRTPAIRMNEPMVSRRRLIVTALSLAALGEGGAMLLASRRQGTSPDAATKGRVLATPTSVPTATPSPIQGKVLWTNTHSNVWTNYRAAPLVDGILYLQTGASVGSIAAIRARDGVQVRTYVDPFAARGGGLSSLQVAVADGFVCGTDDETHANLIAFGLQSAAIKWTRKLEAVSTSSPLPLKANIVVSDTSGAVAMMRLQDGTVIWNQHLGGAVNHSDPVAQGSMIFLGSDDSNVYALNTNAGSILWRAKTGAPVQATPAVAYDRVFVGSTDSSFYAINANDGSIEWTYPLDTPVYTSAPSVAGSVVLVVTGGGFLYALSALDGRLLWKQQIPIGESPLYSPGDPSYSTPVVVGQIAYIGTPTGVAGLSIDDGGLRWQWETNHSGPVGTPTVSQGIIYAASAGSLSAIQSTA